MTRTSFLPASLAACVVLAAGCGGATQSPASAAADREWAANARGLLGILQRDLTLSTTGGATLPAARHALHDGSTIYTILVAYTDFGGCDHMVSSAGPPPPRFVRAELAMRAACATFQRAARLFTEATRTSSARDLLAATRAALAASPRLQLAEQQLQAASSRRSS